VTIENGVVVSIEKSGVAASSPDEDVKACLGCSARRGQNAGHLPHLVRGMSRYHQLLTARAFGRRLFLTVLVASQAVPAEPTVQVELDYRGSPGCPDSAWFMARVRARTIRVGFEPAAPLRLLLWTDGDALEGSLDLRGPGLEPLIRGARGKTCDEVVDALALIVAMALDPTVTPGSATPLATSGPPSVAAPPAEPATPMPVASATPSARTTTPPPSESARPRRRPKAVLVDVGAGAAVAGGMAPGPSPGALVFLEASGAAPGLWAPTVVVAVELDQSTTVHRSLGDARFTRVLGRAEGCPLRVAPWPSLGIRACAAFEYGMLAGSGSHTVDGTVQRDRWLAPALGLRGEWRPHPAVVLVLDGLASRPLVRDRFFFAPNGTIYRVPAFALGATLGVAATLP
jgi:hypothetical protein